MKLKQFPAAIAASSAAICGLTLASASRADEPENDTPVASRVLMVPPAPGESASVVIDANLVDPEPGRTFAQASSARAIAPITISGRLFYNDRRTQGNFEKRFRPDGMRGTQCRAGLSCGPNWLGAKNMVVDAYEIDRPRRIVDPTDGDGPRPRPNSLCPPRERVATATVDARGFFQLTIDKADRCEIDRLANIAIQLQFRAAFCGNGRCYLIRPENGVAYAISHPRASQTSPKIVRAGQSVTMPDAFFNTAANPDVPNRLSIAANYYAALVDTTDFVHLNNSVPFYQANYGGVTYVYPSTRSNSATAKSPTEVVISDFADNTDPSPTTPGQTVPAWPAGRVVAHEYGHILMQRAWNGSYGPNLIGKSAGDGARADAPSNQRAFKEAWAEFTAHAVFDGQYSCREVATDDNASAPAGTVFGPANDGTAYRFNVRKMLCDWYDNRADDDPNLAGAGDNFHATNFRSMWSNLRRMYADRARYGGQFTNPGLMACDWVNYYRVVRNPTSRQSIDDLIANNNITCTMPPSITRTAPVVDARTPTSPRIALPPDPPEAGD